jgi:probable HAF family extracellular repeat protein
LLCRDRFSPIRVSENFTSFNEEKTVKQFNLKQRLAVLCLAYAPFYAGAASYDVVDIFSYPGVSTYGYAMNATGQVTGFLANQAIFWDGSSLYGLGALGGDFSYGFAVNASGWVTGIAYGWGNSYVYPFLWTGIGTSMQNLGAPGWSNAINDSGWITGLVDISATVQRAFLWNGTAMQDLGTLGGTTSVGTAINASGWVTGNAQTAGNAADHAFLWNGNSMQDLGALGANNSYGVAINPSGWVTGHVVTPSNVTRAILWNGRTLQDLGTLGGDGSYAFAINANGSVAGYAQVSGNVADHAVIWSGGSIRDLGTLGGFSSFAVAINGNGWAVGGALTTGNAEHAFVWDGTSMIDLNTAIPAGNPFVLFEATAINDAGQIMAHGWTAWGGDIHTFVLSPAPQFAFAGFFPPVNDPPATNSVNGGQAVPVKFSLGGNRGFDIFAPGYPASQLVSCATFGSPGPLEPTVTSGTSGLQYDPASDQYTYVWKTINGWAQTCRVLIFKFTDGSQHTAQFRFR